MKCYKYLDVGDNGISKVTGNGLDSMIQFLEVAGIFLFIIMCISSQRLIQSYIHKFAGVQLLLVPRYKLHRSVNL